MDSLQSHPLSTSGSDSSFSGTDSDSDSDGSTPRTSSQGGGSTSKNKRKETETKEGEDQYVDITGTSSKRSKTESSTARKENQEQEDTASGIPVGDNEDLNLLIDIQDFYLKRGGSYPFGDLNKLQDFFDQWIQPRANGVYANVSEMSKKMDEISSRYFEIMERISNGEDIKSTMDPLEKQIFNFSNNIWGEKDSAIDGNDSKDLKDSSEEETGDDLARDSKGSSSKDTSEQETSDTKFSSAKGNDGGSSGS